MNQIKTLAALTVALAVCMPTANAGNWSLGASALVSPDPYRGKNDRVYPVPVVSYESDNFFTSERWQQVITCGTIAVIVYPSMLSTHHCTSNPVTVTISR